jgi:hypothetical protein
MKTLAIVLVMFPMVALGMDRMSALSMIETGNNDHMVGRAGEISRYQIMKREWRAVSKSRSYSNPSVARTVALRILNQRISRFEALHNREPNDFEFYALWNAPSQVLRGRISPVVAERCERFANLCSLSRVATQTAQLRLPATTRGL